MSDPTPEWQGKTRIEGPTPAVTRSGKAATRKGETFSAGTVFALDKGTNEPVARLTFEVYQQTGMVLLGNADADGLLGGADRRGEGAGRAMLDALDARFAEVEWWLAVDPADHSDEGLALMRSRRKTGRKRVHSSACTERLAEDCSCEL